MTAIIVPCPHCSKSAQLESDSMPDKPAYFACPSCKQKVVVDKRKLLGQELQQPSAPTPAPQPPMPSAAPPQPPMPDPVTSAAAAAPPPASMATFASTAPTGRRFPKLPDDACFPSGIILGENDTLVAEVQRSLAALNCDTELAGSTDIARQMIINEQPELCVYVGGQIPAPPYSEMAALTGLPPNFRRRLFVVLIADNLKTLDGNSAFLYQVNLIVAKQDFPHLGPALHSGLDYHERLYKSYFQAQENKGAI
jgi:hypothetical protein